jgi:hypothetical protein
LWCFSALLRSSKDKQQRHQQQVALKSQRFKRVMQVCDSIKKQRFHPSIHPFVADNLESRVNEANDNAKTWCATNTPTSFEEKYLCEQVKFYQMTPAERAKIRDAAKAEV